MTGGTKVQVIAQGLRGTEGPIMAPDGSLIFTEQTAALLTKIDASDNRSTYLENTNGANGVTFDAKGRLIATQPDRGEIAVLSPAPRTVLASEYNGQKLQRPNDLIADRKGGIYFTDPGANPPAGQAAGPTAVYYIRPNGTLLRIADDITRPNGIILSPDERVLYVANTLGDAVIAWDVNDDGTVRGRREFVKLQGVTKTDTGVRSGADGLAVDNAGRLYVATQIGVQVISPQGMHWGRFPSASPTVRRTLRLQDATRRSCTSSAAMRRGRCRCWRRGFAAGPSRPDQESSLGAYLSWGGTLVPLRRGAVWRSFATAGSTCLRRSGRSWRPGTAFRPGSP